MEIFVLPNGPFSVNTYCITENNKALIIDPGSESLPAADFLRNDNITPAGIIITHPHIDHVQGIPFFQKIFTGLPTYLSADGKDALNDIASQARLFGLPLPDAFIITDYINGEATIEIGPFSIQCLATPGHCDGSLTFNIRGALFSGDTLFRGTIGRTDLSGGDHALLIQSIQSRIMTFDDDTPVYPGHGDKTTVGYERKRNPFLQGFQMNINEY